MSETPAATAAPTSTPTPATVAAVKEPQGKDEPLGEPGKKALDAERARAEKAEKDLAALRKQVEDASKTAEQKAADDLKAANDAARDAQLRALKYEVAAEKGLNLALAARMTGATREELEADADTLITLIPASPDGTTPVVSQPGPYVPTEGTPPSGAVGASTAEQFAAAVAKAL